MGKEGYVREEVLSGCVEVGGQFGIVVGGFLEE